MRRSLWLSTLSLLFAGILMTRAGAQAPRPNASDPVFLVKDINQGTLASSPADLTAVGNALYFTADDGSFAPKLWRTDGSGVTPLGDGRFLYPRHLTNVNGTLYFAAGLAGTAALSLWRSDGTYSGTVLLRTFSGADLSNLTNINGTLFFTAAVDSSGVGLWKSDGTPAGTVLVKNSLVPYQITNVRGTLFFANDDSIHGSELWKSDGTAAGTVLVLDIFPGEICQQTEHGPECSPAGSNPGNLIDFNGTLLFAATSPLGRELWRSDGTPAGTRIVKDINPGQPSADVSAITLFNGALFFAADDGATGSELWRSDGTTAGTKRVGDFVPGANGLAPFNLLLFGNTLFFGAAPAFGGIRELWKSDGTTAGTVLVKKLPYDLVELSNFVPAAQQFFFVANSDLWCSDGTAAGTMLLKTFPDWPVPAPAWLTNVNGVLFFAAVGDTHGIELWRSDGTPAGTTLFKDINMRGEGSSFGEMANLNGTLYFAGPGEALWKSDGTAAGTAPIRTFEYDIPPEHLTELNGALFFVRNSLGVESELWKSDGTQAGTSLLGSFHAQLDSLQELMKVGGTLYFVLDQRQLWKSDGTVAGTQLVKDLRPFEFGADVRELVAIGSTLFFIADDGVHGLELWKSNGTPAGTVMVKDIKPGASGSNPGYLTDVGGTLFFTASGAAGERQQLWKSDGTPAGTVLVKDIDTIYLAAINGTLFFSADDGVHGWELWKSDGTAAGTVLVKDIAPGSASSNPWQLTDANGTLFFITEDDSQKQALWRSDGTAAGTTLVKDFGELSPLSLTNIRGALLFFTNPNGPGQIWKSDGTPAGTTPIKTLEMESPAFTLAGDLVFFSGDDGVVGDELWALTARAGVDTYAQAPALVGVSPGGAAAITVQYSNSGTTMATGAVLTATLSAGLTYLDDTSGISPTVSGRTVVWRLPNIGFHSSRQFSLRAQAPDSPYGSRYPIILTLTASGPDALPADNRADVVVMIAHQTYLPAVRR